MIGNNLKYEFYCYYEIEKRERERERKMLWWLTNNKIQTEESICLQLNLDFQSNEEKRKV